MDLKLIFEVPSGKVLGAQAIGYTGVEKRIDVIATAIAAGMTVRELQDIELAYAPPFSSAKDPVNMAGYAASNILDGLVKKVDVMEIDQLVEDGEYLLDIRTGEEYSLGNINGSVNIPLDELRDRMDEIPKDRIIYQNGFNTYNLDGGYSLYSNYKRVIKKDTSCIQGKGIACTDNSDALPKKSN